MRSLLVPALVQATVTPKSLSHCNIPFWFLTVGLAEQEGTQTAKVRVGSGLVWLGVTSHLPWELPGSWPPLYLELVSSVAAISWVCGLAGPVWFLWGIPKSRSVSGKGLRTLPQFWASLDSRALISARIRMCYTREGLGKLINPGAGSESEQGFEQDFRSRYSSLPPCLYTGLGFASK